MSRLGGGEGETVVFRLVSRENQAKRKGNEP